MNINDAFPSKWLKASDVTGDMVVTISGIRNERIGADGDTKPVVSLQENTKGLVLNKTNADVLIRLFGQETDDWIGKRIVLYAAEVAFQGKVMMAVRIRLRQPAQKPTTTEDEGFAV